MRLKKIHIQNFRSICNVEINLGKQTAILGGNGAGKSTILRALDKFYGPSTQVDLEDFFNRDAREPIRIALTFIEFSSDEATRFSSRIHGDEMTVMRIFEAKGRISGQYYGQTRRHEGFATIREITAANDKKNEYKKLRDTQGESYSDLPLLTKASDIEAALNQWEQVHLDRCELMLDDGRFFGFTNVANGALQKSTAFVFIPAVRDASADAIDGRGSAISKLMELVVRSAIQKRQDIQTWQSRVLGEYRELTNPDNLPELKNLAGLLTGTLKQLYAESSVELTWKPIADFDVPLPMADVALEDGGFQSPVDRQGHGLQRAFILTLLQHLASVVNRRQSQENEEASVLATVLAIPEVESALPGLILAIEEPELYQHPAKQRHFSNVLAKLTTGSVPGVAGTTQVIFASHSPYFISVGRFDEVRVARRQNLADTNCKQCEVTEASLVDVVRRLESAFLEPVGSRNVVGLETRLHVFSSDLAEGFFADLVVLVEGISDRAALLAIAEIEQLDMEAFGIAVLVVDGKESMPNPAAIFTALGIPVYLVWDCDAKEGKLEHPFNSALQRLTEVDPRLAQVRPAQTYIGPRFSCFETCFDKVLKMEIGTDVYEQILKEAVADLSLGDRNNPQKVPAVMTNVLLRAADQGRKSSTGLKILQAIRAMAESVRSIS